MDDSEHADGARDPMTFENLRRSFYYVDHADMQFKFLVAMPDETAADALAKILDLLGEAFDTGDLTLVSVGLLHQRLALISVGGVFRVGDDPMGPDAPGQQESLVLIKDFLKTSPTLSRIPKDTPDSRLTARHPGYDALTARRDPGSRVPARSPA